jgi:hypothetical protein
MADLAAFAQQQKARLERAQQFDFVGYFKFLEKHGYVEFVR